MLCPGSRSGPLALAAGGLAKDKRIDLYTSIDERSAGFLALGLSTSFGQASAVVTTSGSAVANLLPAAVEADRSSQPLLLITADRPSRLKNCGANQTVNQEDFLSPVCRCFLESPKAGLHLIEENKLEELIDIAWSKAHKFPGPIHLNVPLEEPLCLPKSEQKKVWINYFPLSKEKSLDIESKQKKVTKDYSSDEFFDLDPLLPGVIIVGPWRGKKESLNEFNRMLSLWHEISKWPVLADPLSGLFESQKGVIHNWDLFLELGLRSLDKKLQVLRLGPLPSSRSLEKWLIDQGEGQLVITECDFRSLDPLKLSNQWSYGFIEWMKYKAKTSGKKSNSSNLQIKLHLDNWYSNDKIISRYLEKIFPLQGFINEPALAYWLPKILPKQIPIMLAASSPIRDFLTYSGESTLSRRFFGFRGASGIDGTLSLSMGLAIQLGTFLLVTGDLALLHDNNGWLLSSYIKFPLIILLIDNGGGGIFKRLPIEGFEDTDIEQLFTMPQKVDYLSLANSYGIPSRQISCFEDLPVAIEWGLSKSGPVLLRVCANTSRDLELRNKLKIELKNQFSREN